ncbi:MAG: hypothetical protein IKS03_01405 [Ruminococcus sp.]|nr:hypothetical protein [Ruminococcus sp.]
MKKIDSENYYCPFCDPFGSEDEERLPLSEAALIWGSSGEDEDYTFGYSEEELRNELYGG